jgi:hypothetical protein
VEVLRSGYFLRMRRVPRRGSPPFRLACKAIEHNRKGLARCSRGVRLWARGHNATGVFAQLVAAHVGERGAAQSDLEMKDAALAAKIESQKHIVGDLDRRLGQIDTAIEEAAKCGRTTAALSAMDGQRKARAALVEERKREAGAPPFALQTERASGTAQGRKIETGAAPIRYVAELLGLDTECEKAIRWLIALMVLCCDPLAIALTAAASARR